MGAKSKPVGQSASLEGLLGTAVALLGGEFEDLTSEERQIVAAVDHERTSPSVVTARIRNQVQAGKDPLGSTLSAIRSAEVKREMGAIFTPPAIVRSMISWAVAAGRSFDRIVDAGAGSSRFLSAAGVKFPDAELVAVELDPIARIISRANLKVLGLNDRSRIVADDYRSLVLDELDGPTLFIGNPPYVRHHQIPAAWKEWLAETASTLDLKASKLAGLHVYFFLATAQLARPGDVGSFITSSEWLDVNYGRLVRELLLGQLGVSSVHVIAPEAHPFEDAMTTGVITCFEPDTKPSTVNLRKVKRSDRLGDLSKGQAVSRDRLLDATRWTPLLRAAREIPEGYIELGELFRVHRGAVTGANRIWVVDPDETDLPDSVLFRSVTRAKELFAAGRFLSHDGKLRAVVDLPADLGIFDSSERKSVNRFIRSARQAGAHEGYVARHRRSWWSVGLREPAPILATYMARRPPAFVRNTANARHINIAHGLYPRQTLPSSAIKEVAEVLNRTTDMSSGRTYAGGLVKFEPREMERLLIPDVTLTPT